MGQINIIGIIGKDVTSADVMNQLAAYPENEAVDVFLFSQGGDVNEGLKIMNSFARHKGEVSMFVDRADSITASILQGASPGKRFISANGQVGIHLPMVMPFAGPANELDLEKAKEFLQTQKCRLISTFIRTGLSEARLGEMLQNETFLDAKTAKALGFVDEIAEQSKAVAMFKELFGKLGLTASAEGDDIGGPDEGGIKRTIAQTLEELSGAGITEDQIVQALAQLIPAKEPAKEPAKATTDVEPPPAQAGFWDDLKEDIKKEFTQIIRRPAGESQLQSQASVDDPYLHGLMIKDMKADGLISVAMEPWAMSQSIAQLKAYGQNALAVVPVSVGGVPNFDASAVVTDDQIQTVGTMKSHVHETTGKEKEA